MPVGSRQIIWSGGEDTFCLAKVGHILDLEEKCKAPIGVIAARLENGAYGLNDIRETIRLALIGGGMAPDKAMDKVVNHVEPPLCVRPLEWTQRVASRLPYQVREPAMDAPLDVF